LKGVHPEAWQRGCIVTEEGKLSALPDGYGFYYGWRERDGKREYVNVLPPRELWRGETQIPEYGPDPIAWKILLDGDEAARVDSREAVEERLGMSFERAPPEIERLVLEGFRLRFRER
jgi:hypothetical protein